METDTKFLEITFYIILSIKCVTKSVIQIVETLIWHKETHEIMFFCHVFVLNESVGLSVTIGSRKNSLLGVSAASFT